MTQSMPAPIIPRDMNEISIETMDGTLEFYGKLLGVVDNERRGRPRWAEIELYKYIDTDESHISGNPDLNTYGHQLYLLHTMGHSVVYHVHESHCNKGIVVPVDEFEERAEFPEDLEPCEYCCPADWRDAEEGRLYELEVLRHLIYKCRTAEDVLVRLRRPPRHVPGRHDIIEQPVLSSPGQRLVEMVRHRDEGIARAARRTVHLLWIGSGRKLINVGRMTVGRGWPARAKMDTDGDIFYD